MKESWTRVFDGTKIADGECSYSIEFFEPFDEATPKIITMTAVDTRTCQTEFQIGIPVKPTLPNPKGGIVSGDEWEATPEKDSSDRRADSKRSFALPGALDDLTGGSSAIPLLSNRDRKFTVTSEWRDPELAGFLDKTIVLVSMAVKSKVQDREITKGHCKRGFWRQQLTFWQQDTSGKWDDKSCKFNRIRLVGETNAHFFNEDFPGCTPTLHIYYLGFWAKVTNNPPGGGFPNGYHWGMEDHWWEGGACGALIRWMEYRTIPHEYYRVGEDVTDDDVGVEEE